MMEYQKSYKSGNLNSYVVIYRRKDKNTTDEVSLTYEKVMKLWRSAWIMRRLKNT